MGIEIYGLRPTSRTGHTFRRGIWRWRPTWDYVYNQHQDIADKVEEPFYPDGCGLDSSDSLELACRLTADIESGAVNDYAATLDTFSHLAPNMSCATCGGSGVRVDEAGVELGMPAMELEPELAVRLGRSRGWCDGCDGVGTTDKLRMIYKLEVDEVRRFAEFLESCGGFEIW